MKYKLKKKNFDFSSPIVVDEDKMQIYETQFDDDDEFFE